MTLGFDISSLVPGGALAPVAAAATSLPSYTQNRERVAAAVELGYQGIDFYEEWRSTLFVASLIGLGVSGTALTKRRKNPEAVALYGIIAAVSAGMAWFTRPDLLRGEVPVPANGPAHPSTPVIPATLSWLDARGDRLTASDPGWEARTLRRLANDLGTGTIDPAIDTLLSRNAH